MLQNTISDLLRYCKTYGYIPDTYYRQRDPRFPEKNLYRKAKNLYALEDFTYLKDEDKH